MKNIYVIRLTTDSINDDHRYIEAKGFEDAFAKALRLRHLARSKHAQDAIAYYRKGKDDNISETWKVTDASLAREARRANKEAVDTYNIVSIAFHREIETVR